MLIPLEDVLSLVPVGQSTLYKLMNDPAEAFPRPLNIGRRVFWQTAEIEAWLEQKAADRKQG